MKAQEFKQYEGKRVSDCRSILEPAAAGAIVIGYSPDNEDEQLYVRLENKDGNTKTYSAVLGMSNNEMLLYKNCSYGCGYSYLWVTRDDIEL